MTTNKLFVSNLSWDVQDRDLSELFSSVGYVSSVKIPTRREDGKPRGFAFVEMQDTAQAEQVINQFNEYMMQGRPLRIHFQDENRENRSSDRGSSGYGSRSEQPNSKLFVRNVDSNLTENDLYTYFGQVGHVVSAKIPVDRDTGMPKRFAFVEMSSADQAQQAINQLNNTPLGNEIIEISFQDPNRQKSRPPQGRGGGGYRQSSGHRDW